MGKFRDDPGHSGTVGNPRWKIFKKISKLDIRKYFFSERVVQRWNKLSQAAVELRTINGFEQAMDKRRRMEMDFFID